MVKRGCCRAIICAAVLLVCIFFGAGLTSVFAGDGTLDKTSATVGIGRKVGFSVTGTSKKIKWKSSDINIATVTKKGVVKGINPGNAKITATFGKKSLTAKVKVRTFLISDKKIELTEEKSLKLTLLTDDGFIKSRIEDKDICSVSFGEWLGSDVPVNITPKKVGSTKIYFSNTANDETLVLNVKVKSVPVIASIGEPEISTGAKIFIPAENTMRFSFTLSGAVNDCYAVIYSERGDAIRTINVGAVGANTVVPVTWDGTDAEGNQYEGKYTVGIVATGVDERSDKMYRIMQKSPFKQGDGSIDNPFMFGNAQELALIPQYDDEGVYFQQYADIDLNGNMEVAELFPTAAGLRGTVNGYMGGQRFVIANYMSSKSLFGYVGETGCISRVTMTNALISGGGATMATQNYGIIDSCKIQSTISITKTNNLKSGMMVITNYGSITGCECSGDIKMTLNSLSSVVVVRIGGIAGENSGQIHRCSSKVDINISISMSSTTEEGTFAYVGGVVGENPEGAVVSDAVYSGRLSYNMDSSENGPTAYCGGICGVNNGILSGCSFTGNENLSQFGYGAGISS